jgi:hypothetical protein
MRRITAPKSPRSVGRFDAKQATMDAMSEAAAREQKRVALVVHYADGSSQTWLQVGYRAKDAFIRAEGEWQDAFEWLSQEARRSRTGCTTRRPSTSDRVCSGSNGRAGSGNTLSAPPARFMVAQVARQIPPTRPGPVEWTASSAMVMRLGPRGFRAEEGLARKVGDVVDEEP